MSDMSPGEWFFFGLVAAAVIVIGIAVLVVAFPRYPKP